MKKLIEQLILIVLMSLGLLATPLLCNAQTSPTDTTLGILKKQDSLRQSGYTDTAKAMSSKPKLITLQPENPKLTAKDTAVKKTAPFQPNPKKAGLYSALIPGLGQIYNRQLWKLPIVYAGLGTAGYFLIKNLNDYQSFRKAYLGRINNPYPTDEYVLTYTTEQLQQKQNDLSKYLNLSVLFGSLGYALQVLDAITAAHLKNFDVSRDISMRMKPVLMPQGVGLGLVLDFHAKELRPLPYFRP